MRRLFSFQTLYIYTFLVIIISVIPITIRHSHRIPIDKIVHLVIYLLFSFLTSNTLAFYNRKHSRLKGFLYPFALGVIIEIVQHFLPYRRFEALDILSNALGALLGTFLRIGL